MCLFLLDAEWLQYIKVHKVRVAEIDYNYKKLSKLKFVDTTIPQPKQKYKLVGTTDILLKQKNKKLSDERNHNTNKLYSTYNRI